MAAQAHLQEQIRQLPHRPGIYKYFDVEDTIIYVGKAVDIRKRVSSYFTKQDHNKKTQQLVRNIKRLEFTIVDSESDAFLLENNLIKQHQPKYNQQADDVTVRGDHRPVSLTLAHIVARGERTGQRPAAGQGQRRRLPFRRARAVVRRLIGRTQIDRLTPHKREQVQKAVSMVGSVLIGKFITRELILRATQAVGVRLTAKQAAKYVPIAGQAVSAALGYATLRYLGEQHLRDCVQVAKAAQLTLPAPRA